MEGGEKKAKGREEGSSSKKKRQERGDKIYLAIGT